MHEKGFGEARGVPFDKIAQTSWVAGGEARRRTKEIEEPLWLGHRDRERIRSSGRRSLVLEVADKVHVNGDRVGGNFLDLVAG